MTIPRSDHISTKNGWKSVPLDNVNCTNLNRFRLKRLIPKEHDLSLSRGGEFDCYPWFHVASRADSTWHDNSWSQALIHSKRKILDSWRTGWKQRLAQALLCICKVFKNHLYYLWHVRVLSIKPCLHTQLPEHNRSYWKVSRGWGHLITWNGPIMGHLNSFSASGRGDV